MTQINRATDSLQFHQISDLAAIIWLEHYTPIIGADQVIYMLDKFQSVEAIKNQVIEGSEYYVLIQDGNLTGYFCVNRKKDSLFLSKLYVLKKCQGKGIGKRAMLYIQRRAEELGYTKITLTVNKYNHKSIKAYEKMGFQKIKALIQDIGNNYIMDDFLLEKKIITTNN
jgi:diamine N-acetyltransferase